MLEHVPLAPRCTLGVGGPARFFVEAPDEAAVADAVRWAARRGVPLRVLGGGSNLVVADEGVDGLVVHVAARGIRVREDGAAVELTAAAGEPWDDVVCLAVERGWAGLECLSGIPGLVGATPIQNVGAYGQEVAETIVEVRVLDRRTGEATVLGRAACGFGYRDSVFKRAQAGRWIVLAVSYRLAPGGRPAVRYGELARHLETTRATAPTLVDVREAVLAIRRAKSMVLDPADDNRRTCGSFFLNPVVTAGEVTRLAALPGGAALPRWPQPDGCWKLSAAWLIEQAGFRRGHRAGPVGLSTRHALALVAHEGASTRDVLALARQIRDAVLLRFGVRLEPEPALWGAAAL